MRGCVSCRAVAGAGKRPPDRLGVPASHRWPSDGSNDDVALQDVAAIFAALERYRSYHRT